MRYLCGLIVASGLCTCAVGIPKTVTLFDVVGQSPAKVSSLMGPGAVMNGGFNAIDEKDQKAIPFGIRGFEYDSWSVYTGAGADDPKEISGTPVVGASFYAYVYGAPSQAAISKAFHVKLSSWKKSAATYKNRKGETVKNGDLYSNGKLRFAISPRADKQFTALQVWQTR